MISYTATLGHYSGAYMETTEINSHIHNDERISSNTRVTNKYIIEPSKLG
jgi:hypothetical protein